MLILHRPFHKRKDKSHNFDKLIYLAIRMSIRGEHEFPHTLP